MTSLSVSPAADDAFPSPIHDDLAPAVATPTLEFTYQAFAPKVLAYFRSHRMDGSEDLVGEVFVSVARGLDRFRGDNEALGRWIFTIARRRRVDAIRRRVLRRHVFVRELPDQAVHDHIEGIDPDLVSALHTLTSLQRDVVVLRFVADLPIASVARMLHRSPGAVKALQVRALNQLGARLHRPDE